MIDAKIGLRNLGRNRRRTLLTGSLISFGVLCLIVFQALKVGMHNQMILSTTSLDSGILQIHAPEYRNNRTGLQPLAQPDQLVAKLTGHHIAFSARLKTAALILAGPQSSMLSISGVHPDHERQITQIAANLVEGTYLQSAETIVLSRSLAQAMSLAVGDQVTVMAQDSGGQPALIPLRIQGLYDTGLPSFDNTHAYVTLDTMQHLLKADNVITEIAIHSTLNAQSQAESQLHELLDERYVITRWQQNLPDLVQLIELNDTTMSILIVIVFSLVGMGILNTMTMVTYERFQEFGLLSAMGYPPAGVLRMVLYEALFLGVGSAIVGSFVASLICIWLSQHGLDLSQFTSSNPYFTNAHILYPQTRLIDVVSAAAMACLTCVISSVFPAWKVSHLDPVEALRHQ
ncbi:MAG: hypothetical protein C0620_03535 [Desulfuromonas sp.]|nr:MAG: hypothetical protein C0620_03535 [Desulfuromonas sp.]